MSDGGVCQPPYAEIGRATLDALLTVPPCDDLVIARDHHDKPFCVVVRHFDGHGKSDGSSGNEQCRTLATLLSVAMDAVYDGRLPLPSALQESAASPHPMTAQTFCPNCKDVFSEGDRDHPPVDFVIDDPDPVIGVRRIKGFMCWRAGGGYYTAERIKDGIIRGAL